MTQFATSAKTYGKPVMLAPFHEMNGNWDPWGYGSNNTPAKLISAWKRMHGIFASANATNVKFAWVINNDSVPSVADNAIELYYPGSQYVDYVGIDGFNFNNPWESFSSIFDSPLQKVATYQKPVYITSFASAAGSQKAAWITDALTVQIPKHPEIAGWVWFNENKEQNWLIWSDNNSLNAFKAALP